MVRAFVMRCTFEQSACCLTFITATCGGLWNKTPDSIIDWVAAFTADEKFLDAIEGFIQKHAPTFEEAGLSEFGLGYTPLHHYTTSTTLFFSHS